MKLCFGMTKDGYSKMHYNSDEYRNWMHIGEFVIAAIGLVIVFLFYRERTKPTFAKIIWALILLAIFTGVTELVFWKKNNN